MSEEQSVSVWLQQLKADDSMAAFHLWRRYVERLCRLAKRKLSSLRPGAVNEDDVVQSVFAAFLVGAQQGRFMRLDDRNDLWQVLVMLTERKAISQLRRERAAKRGGGATSIVSAADHAATGSQEHGISHLPSRDPTPEFAAEVREQLNKLLQSLSVQNRQIAAAKLEGYSNPEIADQLGVSLRSVEKRLSNIRSRWLREELK